MNVCHDLLGGLAVIQWGCAVMEEYILANVSITHLSKSSHNDFYSKYRCGSILLSPTTAKSLCRSN